MLTCIICLYLNLIILQIHIQTHPYKRVRLLAEMKVVSFPIEVKVFFKFKFVIILFID